MYLDLDASQAEMLRVHIAARRLGCSTRTIRRLIQNGELPAQRYGRRPWLVLSTDLEYLRRRKGAW